MTTLSNGFADYFRLMLVLGGILLLAFVAIRFWLPKLMPWNRPSSGPMRIWARLPLEPQRTLYIIKAGQSFLMVASSEAGVQYIMSLNAEDFRDASEHTEPQTAESRFAPLIRTQGDVNLGSNGCGSTDKAQPGATQPLAQLPR